MLQLHKMGEKPEHYADIWHFTEGKTESRFPLYDYPKSDLRTTPEYSHCVL